MECRWADLSRVGEPSWACMPISPGTLFGKGDANKSLSLHSLPDGRSELVV